MGEAGAAAGPAAVAADANRALTPEEADSLYTVPLEDFVSERNELAKQLRADGKKAEADAVRKLKKPSVPAWAINRASQDDAKSARRLVESAEQLAAAQSSGGDELRAAMSESADAVEAVMEGVTEVLSDSGHDAPANLDRARNTLRALATDEELRAEFEAGLVVTDHEPVGFGAAAGKIKPAPRKRQREDQAERRRRKQAAARVERAKTALERADRAVDDTRGKLRVAEDERVKRAEELEKAEAELGT